MSDRSVHNTFFKLDTPFPFLFLFWFLEIRSHCAAQKGMDLSQMNDLLGVGLASEGGTTMPG